MKPANLVLMVHACMSFLGFCFVCRVCDRFHLCMLLLLFSTICPCSFHIFFSPGLTMVDATTYRFGRTVDVFLLFVCLILSTVHCCY